MKQYLLNESTINAVLDILGKQPYVDVFKVVQIVQSECANQPDWEIKKEVKDGSND